jgi:hypothetical protein
VLNAIDWSLANPSNLVSAAGTSPEPDLNSLFISGHSAGAIHSATLTFHRDLIPVGSDLRNRIKGVVLEGGPHHYLPICHDMAVAHWGSEENATENSSLSLLLSWFSNNKSAKPPKILVVQAENEPRWIYNQNLDYHKVLEWHLGESVEYVEAKGHNHISFFCSLSSGEGEEWGVRTADWMWEVLHDSATTSGGGRGAGVSRNESLSLPSYAKICGADTNDLRYFCSFLICGYRFVGCSRRDSEGRQGNRCP